MPTSIFENSEQMWMADLEQRSLQDLIDVDFEFALHHQNTNAIRTCVGRLLKHELDEPDIERIHILLKQANGFNAAGWMDVLRMCHLHDKKLNIAYHWVNNTPTVADKLQELLQQHPLYPEQHTKTQAVVVQYALRTPYIKEVVAKIPPLEQQTVIQYMLEPLSSQWKSYSGNTTPWDIQSAVFLSGIFPQYSRAVFYRIAASAFAFHTVNRMYIDQSIKRSSFYRALDEQGNEGISASALSMLALDSSMSFNHHKSNMIKHLEEIYTSAPSEQQHIYLQDLAQSKFATVLEMSDILQSAAQKMMLEEQLNKEPIGNQEERLRRI